jgi:Ca2+-binding EF-hand superfamily protein
MLPVALTAQTPASPPPAHLIGPPVPPPPPLSAAALKPLEGSADFISPVGEPYHSEDKLSGAEHWFAAVDADHDGRITPAEYLKDAAAFFARLDRDHNLEIEPAEIEYYETEIAPEIRVVSTGAQYHPSSDDSGESTQKEPYPDRLGAGRYSWIDLPEPIVSMDTNFDRAISRQEFLAAARKRFAALDADHNGVLTRDELPKITPPRLNPHGDDIKRKRGGGHGGRGGGGGGMRGGGGGMGGPGGGMNGNGPGGAQ